MIGYGQYRLYVIESDECDWVGPVPVCNGMVQSDECDWVGPVPVCSGMVQSDE